MEEVETTGADGAEPTPDGPPSPFRPSEDRGPSSEAICRFFAAELADGTIVPPNPFVAPGNRCVAFGDPLPQSNRQQELVCLASAHVNCPRYLRGLLVEATPPPPPRREPVSIAVIGSAFILVAALAASFAFLAVRGGFALDLSAGSAAPSQVVAVASPSPSPRPSPSPTLTPSPTPSPSLTPPPSVSPPPTPTPSPTPQPAATPAPSSDRYAVLTRCPDASDCWIYVVRAGDNLRAIANYFGVSYERILDMNPQINDPTTIHAGDRIRIPTPTR